MSEHKGACFFMNIERRLKNFPFLKFSLSVTTVNP